MYRFQIIAHTQMGESIGLVGSTPELGEWDVTKCLRLQTNGDRYPVWWVDVELDLNPFLQPSNNERIEYKYLRFCGDETIEWESLGPNRWLPLEPESGSFTITVDDGAFGYVQPWPYGYWDGPKVSLTKSSEGLKILVIGSSVALGCSAWLLRGWAWHLAQALNEKYGHQLVNVSQIGANVSTTIDRFAQVVAPEDPDVVIIALSLGNEGLAHCHPHERPAAQRRFESGLQQLIKMTQELGAIPMLGAVYPNGDYNADHNWLLQDTHQRMLNWGVPILDWLAALDNGQGRWKPGISFDPAHPNTEGHRLMYKAIDLSLFDLNQDQLAKKKRLFQQKEAITIYKDENGFQILNDTQEKTLRVINTSKHPYTISPSWTELQIALQKTAKLMPGIYLVKTLGQNMPPSFSVREDRTIESTLDIPPDADLEYSPAFDLFAPKISQILFYDGHLAVLKQGDLLVRVINESDHEYNIQPMWKQVRNALKAMPNGVYTDVVNPDAPFRTMMIGQDALESRVKVPSKSCVSFQYQCPLSAISRVAILPLGDRCAIRMALHKMEYDGPAYPFDLTRTTNLSDVADIIENGFFDMWNPDYLHYNDEAGRIYHSKWQGLSFAHEVEDTEDPVNDMSPIYERMRTRYTARSQRFWYTVNHCDEVLFVRTGSASRGQVIDLVHKLEAKCQEKPFRVLLISAQSSNEFVEIPNVLHYDMYFNPDRMYEDLGYWMHCTNVMRSILDSLGISSKNLFWCPPKIRSNRV
ncbi:MAG TPA: lipase [Cyanothece sp. UBA12306]|nr:lipase [Cyanothece sp. UBA12306]